MSWNLCLVNPPIRGWDRGGSLAPTSGSIGQRTLKLSLSLWGFHSPHPKNVLVSRLRSTMMSSGRSWFCSTVCLANRSRKHLFEFVCMVDPEPFVGNKEIVCGISASLNSRAPSLNWPVLNKMTGPSLSHQTTKGWVWCLEFCWHSFLFKSYINTYKYFSIVWWTWRGVIWFSSIAPLLVR